MNQSIDSMAQDLVVLLTDGITLWVNRMWVTAANILPAPEN